MRKKSWKFVLAVVIFSDILNNKAITSKLIKTFAGLCPRIISRLPKYSSFDWWQWEEDLAAENDAPWIELKRPFSVQWQSIEREGGRKRIKKNSGRINHNPVMYKTINSTFGTNLPQCRICRVNYVLIWSELIVTAKRHWKWVERMSKWFHLYRFGQFVFIFYNFKDLW